MHGSFEFVLEVFQLLLLPLNNLYLLVPLQFVIKGVSSQRHLETLLVRDLRLLEWLLSILVRLCSLLPSWVISKIVQFIRICGASLLRSSSLLR